MAGPGLVLASPRVRRGRVVNLVRYPRALDGIFVPGAEVVGRVVDQAGGPGTDTALAVARRLAELPHPTIALVPLDGVAAAVRSPTDEQFRVVPAAFAALLADVRARTGAVPPWLQHLVVDRVVAFLRADSGLYTTSAALPPEVTEALHAALAAVVADVADEVVAGYDADDEIRLALLLGARARSGHSPPRTIRDAGRGLTRVSYLYFGERPAERFVLDGAAVAPDHHKIRIVDFFGRTLLHERIAWVADTATAEIDRAGEVTLPGRPAPRRLARYRRIAAENRGIARRLVGDLRIRRLAARPATVARYSAAWLLMDRDTAAQDNAEHLYRHLRAHEPEVNAWFVLAVDSHDWDRLRREGFRLLAYGSREHFAALLNCAHLISSQVDSYVTKPFRKHALGPGRWRFTFLQHGVTKDDLSHWLNAKPIDLFITSTPDERAAIVDDGTPYVCTDLEAVLTGMARHDRLLELAAPREATLVLVMPTWRRELLAEQQGGNRRELLAGFWNSDYALAWRQLLESIRLRRLCERQGWQLTFVPHPNMQDYLDTSPLAEHVVSRRFRDIDVPQLLARAAVVVTDYSSLAFDAAYIERPVVYYQFDRAAFFAGGHVYRRGRWSYEQQGFGPVTEHAADAVDAVERIAGNGGPDAEYVARMRHTFPFRDGRCCERIVAAIRSIEGSFPDVGIARLDE